MIGRIINSIVITNLMESKNTYQNINSVVNMSVVHRVRNYLFCLDPKNVQIDLTFFGNT